MVEQQSIEFRDHAADRPWVAAGVLGGIDENQAVMGESALVGCVGDRDEVPDVLSDDCALFLLRCGEDAVVRKCAQLRSRGHGSNIVTTGAELLGDGLRVHLVD